MGEGYKATDEDVDAAYASMGLNPGRFITPDREDVARLLQDFADRVLKPPTDAEIVAGVRGYYEAGGRILSALPFEQIDGWQEKAKPIQVAAFRKAVAEAREAGR